jgi:hypothetical protein
MLVSASVPAFRLWLGSGLPLLVGLGHFDILAADRISHGLRAFRFLLADRNVLHDAHRLRDDRNFLGLVDFDLGRSVFYCRKGSKSYKFNLYR